MVKIKTKPDTNDHKVTIADLNANILNLTAVVKGNSEIIKAASKNVISNSSSSSSTSYSSSSSSSKKTNEKNWAQSAGSEVWKATSTQRGYMGSTLLGGLTGLSPAVVQKMGLDKAVGSIFKSVLGGIKKKWAEAGQSSNNKKINSAIESNKNAGTNKRLDKIIGLLKTRNNAVKTEEKQKSSFLGKLLSFVGSIAGPLLKLAALGAALYGIKNAVEAIAKWLGVLPRDVAETAAPPISGVGSGLKSHAGTQKVRLKNEKLHRDALKEYLEDPYYKKMTPQERAKARYGEVPKDAPKSYREKLANLKRTQAELYETPGITKRAALNSEVRAGQSATKLASGKVTPKITEPVKYKLRDVGPKMENLAGKGLNIAANALIAYDTADRVIDDIKAGEYGKAGADTARGAGTWAGMTVGGKLGAKAGKGWWKLLTGAVGAGGGALLGKEGVEALFPEYYNQLSLEELAETEPWKVRHPYEQLYGVHPGSKAFTDKLIEDQLSGEYGHVPGWRNNQLGGFAKFMLERASKYVPGMGGEEYYWDWANGKPVWTYGVTNQFLDPQWKAYVYAQGRLGRPMPEIPKSAYQGQIGYEKAKSVVDGDYDYIYEQGKIDGEKARAKKQKEKEEAAQKSINPSLVNQMNTDIANFSTPTYGLTTDFEYPIKAADEATGTTEGIEANTRTTNDYLADILAAIENIKTETNSYMTNKNIGEQISRKMGQEEIPSTNTNFPNTLIRYGQTHGKMNG